MALRSSLALGLVFLAQSLAAQEPSIDSSATAFSRLFPVLDDFGQVIPEDTIRATIRPPKSRVKRLIATTLVGAIVFNFIRPRAPNGADCSIYEPCTSREKFYNNGAWFAGAAVGFMLGYGAISDERVDRWEAVEALRARRRAENAAPTPP